VEEFTDQHLGAGVLALHGLHRATPQPWRFHQDLWIGVKPDSRATSPPRRIRVSLSVSAPLCSISKST
jgi:hypothetical protein